MTSQAPALAVRPMPRDEPRSPRGQPPALPDVMAWPEAPGAGGDDEHDESSMSFRPWRLHIDARDKSRLRRRTAKLTRITQRSWSVCEAHCFGRKSLVSAWRGPSDRPSGEGEVPGVAAAAPSRVGGNALAPEPPPLPPLTDPLDTWPRAPASIAESAESAELVPCQSLAAVYDMGRQPTERSQEETPAHHTRAASSGRGGRASSMRTSVWLAALEEDDNDASWSDLSRAEWCWKHVELFVSGVEFDYVSGMLVLANALAMGVEVDHMATNVTDQRTAAMTFFGIFFWFAFGVEVVLRIVVHRKGFITGKDACWNVFDAALVLIQFIEEILRLMLESHGSAMSMKLTFLRLVRVLRLIRVIRVMRILRHIGELRALIMSISGSLRSLLFAVVLLFLMLYLFAMFFTIFVFDHRMALEDPGDASKQLVLYWGTLGDSVFSLYKAVTGGVDWGEAAAPLREEVSVWCVAFLMCYIAFMMLCILNVITGVFVDAALLNARRDKDLYMVNHARHLFDQVDTSQNGNISWQEFEDALGTAEMQEVFRQLDLDVSEAEGLFQLLDADRTGKINADEFISGCCRLRGSAKALDLNLLKMQSRLQYESFAKHVGKLEKGLRSLESATREALRRFSSREVSWESVDASEVKSRS